MAVSEQEMIPWCQTLLGEAKGPKLSLQEYLACIPRLSALAELPSGTVVLVRGDVDAKPGAAIGQGDVRLRSMVETLEYGRQRGWVQVIFGHIGRKPEGSLAAVAKRLGELLQCDVPLVSEWYDEATGEVSAAAAQQVRDSSPGSVLVLENTRRYAIETVLWKAKEADVPKLAPKLAGLANEVASKLGAVYVNEALSAGSLDASSTIVPAGMSRVALGAYVASEFDGPMRRCLETQLVIFSGLKIDKLDDLQAMIARGTIRRVIAAGSLAMALKKGAAQLDGQDFGLGVAEDPAHQDKPYYIPPERVEQAKQMSAAGRKGGVEFVLPIDFVLADGSVSDTIGPGQQQFDVGPKSSAAFEQAVTQFIGEHRAQPGKPAVAFHNGVFGMFEDSRFEAGTRDFVAQLKRMKDAGVEVYVGGGEGGTALEKYGQPDWVTHCFTAGGTVLNALGSQPVPYLQALRMAASRQR
jgi:phosphoglycerate kinase